MAATVPDTPIGCNEDDASDVLCWQVSIEHQVDRLTRSLADFARIVEQRARPNVGLITAVARAHVWYERLLSGEATSLRAIAREQGMTPRYGGRLLRCAFLAPEIVDAILQGLQPPQLTLARLCKNLPLDWARQPEALGAAWSRSIPDQSRTCGTFPIVKKPRNFSLNKQDAANPCDARRF